MGISANTLFHFTGFDSLSEILKSKTIQVKYTKECFEGVLPDNHPFGMCYIPMACFCDLALMQLCISTPHCERYGFYGIGLTKEWGMRRSISPITYVHKKSAHIGLMKDSQIAFSLLSKTNSNASSHVTRALFDSLKLLKPYKGRFHKGRKSSLEIIYYNEREWRFSPDNFTILKKRTEKKGIESLNQKLLDHSLKFEYSDIKFIILKTAECISDFRSKMSIAAFNSLKAKIVVIDRLIEDY